MNDSGMMPESEASRTRTSAHVSEGEADSRSGVACSSNTQLSTRQLVENGTVNLDVFRNGVAGIDWWQGGACVDWDVDRMRSNFVRLERAKKEAQDADGPIPVELGNEILCVARHGQGRGNSSYKEFQLHWRGCVFAVSSRLNPSRQHSNASFQVSGSPCLIVGWVDAWDCFQRTIKNLGGTTTDEWIQRCDLCLDFADVPLHEVFGQSLLNDHFLSTLHKSSEHKNRGRLESFAMGHASNVRVVIYDKLTEVMTAKDPVYKKAMVTLRWAGRIPASATRIEFQTGRKFLRQYGLDRTSDVARLGDLFEKLVIGPKPVLRLVKGAVDRENRHQDRAVTLPAWAAVIEQGQREFGKGFTPLKKVDRTSLDERRACKQVVGFGTRMADRRQRFCGSVAELLELLKDVLEENGIDDQYVLTKFRDKAMESGTWEELLSFQAGEAA